MQPNNLADALQYAARNPQSVLGNVGLTLNDLRDPDAAIQNLMNTGRMTQQQYNQLQQARQQLLSDPNMRQLLFGK
jgi:hypothetical protein